ASLIRGLLGGHPDVHFKPEPGVFDGRRVMRVHLETAADCHESAALRLEKAAAALRKAADPSWKA
ncbi:MAG TPA: hypothetical protein PLY68_10630, partial [Myxococcota bacterium]|nr:hypothetical protein [Myxococcota bacterium]